MTLEEFRQLPMVDARPRINGKPYVCPRVLGIEGEGLMPDPRTDEEISTELFLRLVQGEERCCK